MLERKLKCWGKDPTVPAPFPNVSVTTPIVSEKVTSGFKQTDVLKADEKVNESSGPCRPTGEDVGAGAAAVDEEL